MASTPIYISRVARLDLIAADGSAIGSVSDTVLLPSSATVAPVLGFVANVQRRRIFVNAARVGSIEPTGMRLRTGSIDVRPFKQRPGEKLVLGDLVGQAVGDEVIVDVTIESEPATNSWFATGVALGKRGKLRRRRASQLVEWASVSAQFDAGPEYAEVNEMRQLHAAEVAERIRALPIDRRKQLAELMEDDRLADLLEELPEDEQIRIIEGLDLARAAHVLEEMEPDDAADLLGELPETTRRKLLDAMDTEESSPIRRLLTYADDTAGGLMTPEPVTLPGSATVAEGLAVVREANIPVELAAQIFVVQPPMSTPTGRYLGLVPIQRLLRESPATALEDCTFDDPPPVHPDLPLRAVAERFAAYDATAIPVCDDAGRLVGAITVDDVLDHVLPTNWRRVRR